MAKIFNTSELSPESTLDPDINYWVYNGLDCAVTAEIFDTISPMLDDVTRKTYDLSIALQAPVMEMATRGLLVDQMRRYEVVTEFKNKLEILEDQLTRIVKEGIGVDINWRSPKQLNHLLYDIMGLPVQRKRNANGGMAPTSDRAAIEKLSSYFIAEPICTHLLMLRDLGKKIGFLETGIDPDGYMRSSFNIAGTNTGRLASSGNDFGSGTNMQNIDRTLKEIFIAEPGWKFANLDLGQADSRNIGANCWNTFVESHGEKFAGAYLDACEGPDLHTTVCRMAMTELDWEAEGKTYREIADQIFYRDKSYRDGAKILGHGSNYLGTPVTMAKHSKFPVKLVREFQASYFRAFPEIPLYHKHVEDQIKNSAMLTTIFGRRRFFFGRANDPATIREAVAFMGQSATADAMNHGLLNLWRAGRVRILLQVHDAVLFAYREEEEDEIIPWALEALRVPVPLAKGREFVIPTEAEIGWNYGYYHPEKNPDGMKGWKGGDTRTRTKTKFDFKLEDL